MRINPKETNIGQFPEISFVENSTPESTPNGEQNMFCAVTIVVLLLFMFIVIDVCCC